MLWITKEEKIDCVLSPLGECINICRIWFDLFLWEKITHPFKHLVGFYIFLSVLTFMVLISRGKKVQLELVVQEFVSQTLTEVIRLGTKALTSRCKSFVFIL